MYFVVVATVPNASFQLDAYCRRAIFKFISVCFINRERCFFFHFLLGFLLNGPTSFLCQICLSTLYSSTLLGSSFFQKFSLHYFNRNFYIRITILLSFFVFHLTNICQHRASSDLSSKIISKNL
jgi:hypothetical protein